MVLTVDRIVEGQLKISSLKYFSPMIFDCFCTEKCKGFRILVLLRFLLEFWQIFGRKCLNSFKLRRAIMVFLLFFFFISTIF